MPPLIISILVFAVRALIPGSRVRDDPFNLVLGFADHSPDIARR